MCHTSASRILATPIALSRLILECVFLRQVILILNLILFSHNHRYDVTDLFKYF